MVFTASVSPRYGLVRKFVELRDPPAEAGRDLRSGKQQGARRSLRFGRAVPGLQDAGDAIDGPAHLGDRPVAPF